ncbi:MAG: permease [Thermoguttaceae bacterium]|nr:permease [Thermoguttaceae bacterium]
MNFLDALVDLLLEMAPWILLGFFAAGLLHVFVPKTLFRRFLSGGGVRSVFWGAMLGIPLPLCSCGVIPTAMGLRKDGASRGASVSFLISTPQTGVDSILATWSLMGLPFALIRPIAALITGLAGGIFVNWRTEKDEPKITGETPPEADGPKLTPFGKVRECFRYAFVEMLGDIGKWLTIGLILAAGITVLVPDGLFAGLETRPWLGMFAVLLLACPMYVCATGSIPIAAALMAKGFSPGAAFVLLMAGPATNLGAMLIVGKVLGRKTLVIYLATILAGALLTGLCIDSFCPREWFTLSATLRPACCGGHEDGVWAWVKILSAVLLVGLLVNSLILERFRNRKENEEMKENETGNSRTYQVTGMTCSHCRNFVEKSIRAVPGVEDVTVDLATGRAEVFGPADPEEVKKTVEEAGFEIE